MPSSCVVWTRTKQKRPLSLPLVPSRHVTSRKAFFGSAATTSPTDCGLVLMRSLQIEAQDAERVVHAHGEVEAELANAVPEMSAAAVRAVGQHDVAGDALLLRAPDHVERELDLGLERNVVGDAGFASSRTVLRPQLRKVKLEIDGVCSELLATARLTPIWQLVIFPAEPVYCRCTPTECSPCLRNPVSSMIHVVIGSRSCTASIA